MAEPTIEDYYVEDRSFAPSDAFQSNAIVTDRSLYEEAEADRLGFWARQARELVTWFEDFDTVLLAIGRYALMQQLNLDKIGLRWTSTREKS